MGVVNEPAGAHVNENPGGINAPGASAGANGTKPGRGSFIPGLEIEPVLRTLA
jgi:hypothetical protein